MDNIRLILICLIFSEVIVAAIVIATLILYFKHKEIQSIYFNERALYFKNKALQINKKNTILDIKIEKEKLNYSKNLLEYLKSFIANVTIIKFREFVDNHDITKSTSQQYKNLIREIAETVKSSINVESKTILNDDAVDKFIVDNVIMYIKDLLNKTSEEVLPFDIE